MAKYVSVVRAAYDGKTNTLKARLKSGDGKEVDFEIEALAFAELMGLANITNAVFHHHRTGRDLPLLPVDGIQTGSASHGTPKQYGLGLSLVVQQIGILHFFLPGPIETALREKLKTGPVS